ncbi:MAG: hypothetical protein GEU73_07865 [Chloroflexi bacterium]|nr:hypothetical protein [Chloroflexota bacterium]
MPIGLSHGGANMYTSTEASREVLVGTKDGVAILERRAEGGWALAHHALAGLHISSIIVEPISGMIFAGAFFDRMYASEDGGRTWERRDTGLTVDDVYSLASVQNGDGSRLLAGTQPAHLFCSDDLGHHWRELPAMRDVPTVDAWSFPAPPHVAHTKFITVDPADSSTIYACIEQGALLKSSDQGQTWREINTVGFLSDHDRAVEHFYDVHKAVIDPRDRQRIYVTGGAGLYVTPDGGGRWERWMSPDWAPDVYPDGLVLNPRRPDVLFVAAAEHNPATWRESRYAGGKIFRSADGGRSWQRLRNGLPDRTRHEIGALCLEDWGDSFSVFAATTGGEVYASDDGGDHWSLIASGLAAVSKKGHDQLVAV